MWRLCIILAFAATLLARQHKNEQPPKPLPLPPQPPMAVAAETRMLEFRVSPLLAKGGLGAQIEKSLKDLIHDSHDEKIIKLRAFVAGAGDPRVVQDKAAEIFTDRKLPIPVVSTLQVGLLGGPAAEVLIEAVVEGKRVLNPNGLAFFAGQSAPSLAEAIQRLAASARTASVPAGQILTCTCFVPSLTDEGAMQAAVQKVFPQALIAISQPLRVPDNGAAMCEAIGRLTEPPAIRPVQFLKNSRAALVTSPQLVFTGLQLSFGNYLDDAHEAFTRLGRAAEAVRPVDEPVQMNAFALDSYAASALLRVTTAPPALFTVQTVEGLPSIDASAGIEAVFAPKMSPLVPLGR